MYQREKGDGEASRTLCPPYGAAWYRRGRSCGTLAQTGEPSGKGKRGEDIVNADVESQGYEGTIAETDRNIEIQ